MRDELSEEVLARALGDSGRAFRFFQQIGSTNTEALRWAVEGAPGGAVVVTDHQTAGRGRWGRSWSSTPGRLLQFSVVLRPSLPLDRAGLLTTAVGVACAEGIAEASDLATTIKWPNDVRINGRKACGILLETHVVGSRLEAAVAGVGVNVGWKRDDIPGELRETATSVRAESEGDLPSRADLLVSILRAFERWEPSLHGSADDLLAAATQRSDVLGSEVRVRLSDGTETLGRAERLTATGELEVTGADGTRTISVGEVEQLRPGQAPR